MIFSISSTADVLVRHLASAERDRELDLVALAEELARVVHLEAVVVVLDLGAHLDFLELTYVLLLASPCAPCGSASYLNFP